MYRLLDAEGENRERRDQLIHPPYQKPELLATGPNQLWSWDITKLRGPVKWSFYYLYVILDVFSRYVTGWMISYRETAGLAKQLIENSCEKQKIVPGQLTIHADRGSSMTSKSLALLLADLGVVKTHSRPHVSDDNPFSEAHFKTMKYRPDYPDRFGSIQDARRFCQEFFPWYNHQHHHSGLQLLTPATVHYGQAAQLISKRQAVLDARLPRPIPNGSSARLHNILPCPMPSGSIRRLPTRKILLKLFTQLCLTLVDTLRRRRLNSNAWALTRSRQHLRHLPKRNSRSHSA